MIPINDYVVVEEMPQEIADGLYVPAETNARSYKVISGLDSAIVVCKSSDVIQLPYKDGAVKKSDIILMMESPDA